MLDLVLCGQCGAVRDAAEAAAGRACADCGAVAARPKAATASACREPPGALRVDEALETLDLAWHNERRRHRKVRVTLLGAIGISAEPSRRFGLFVLAAGVVWVVWSLGYAPGKPWGRLAQAAAGLGMFVLAAQYEVAAAHALARLQARYQALRAALAAGDWPDAMRELDRHGALMHWITALDAPRRDGWIWLAAYAAYLLTTVGAFTWHLASTPAQFGPTAAWLAAWPVAPERLAVVGTVWAVGGAVGSVALTALAFHRPAPAPVGPAPAAPAPARPGEPKPPVLIERG